jgi:muramoyltetrapeptide carboxypeptidase
MIVPAPLRPGSRIHVIAPASPFDRCLVLRGLGWLSQRYRVTFRADLFARHGFLAGNDERRLDELSAALRDPTVDAVVTARGGHGLVRIVAAAPFAALRERPKWLVGFSDPTVLHLEAIRVGVASLHAANVAALGRADEQTRSEWITALEQPELPRCYRGLSWNRGRVRGPLVGGNLTLITMMAAAGRLWLPEGCILALEDVTEPSYRVDRMLAVLRSGAHLDRVAGFALGHFTDCSPGPFGVEVDSVLRDHLAHTAPTVAGLEFGHSLPNRPLTMGAEALLDADHGRLITPASSQEAVAHPHLRRDVD